MNDRKQKGKQMLKIIVYLSCLFFGLMSTAIAFEQTRCQQVDSFPSKLLDLKMINGTRIGKFEFYTHDKKHKLNAYFYLPSQFNSNTPIIFVIHGTRRNALDYVKNFAPIAERNSMVIITPEFSKKYYPKSIDFTLGVDKNEFFGKKYSTKQWKKPQNYLYNEIEHLFDGFKQKYKLNTCAYYLYGHSAGGQFIHRMVTFLPKARIIRAVAANSGWYTFTKQQVNNINYYMPYGLVNSPINNQGLAQSFKQKLIILVGEKDTDTPRESKYVRGTKEAMSQGKNRYTRAFKYFETAKNKAHNINTKFDWQLAVVPKANHNSRKISPTAAWYLFKDKTIKACSSSPKEQAKFLQITEILADPAKTLEGDSNNDGIRDNLADEFIELVNIGKDKICLSGWVIGDHDKYKRHVFPIGTELAPGKALVIFGGGIPTGNFGSSIVQWASFSRKLSLNNKGDGIVIHDPKGNLVKHISWGDCGEHKCAPEHIKQSLNINQSVIRSPKNSNNWVPHSTLSNQLFSPGTKTNGLDY